MPRSNQRPTGTARPAVVIVDPDPRQFADIIVACHRAGVPALAIRRIAELERWPYGQIVVMRAAHVTALWKAVGVRHVMAIVEDVADGAAALKRGATEWALRQQGAASVAALLVSDGAEADPAA
jgi:hypothetical protein